MCRGGVFNRWLVHRALGRHQDTAKSGERKVAVVWLLVSV
jgi:hypothetical protein